MKVRPFSLAFIMFIFPLVACEPTNSATSTKNAAEKSSTIKSEEYRDFDSEARTLTEVAHNILKRNKQWSQKEGMTPAKDLPEMMERELFVAYLIIAIHKIAEEADLNLEEMEELSLEKVSEFTKRPSDSAGGAERNMVFTLADDDSRYVVKVPTSHSVTLETSDVE